MDKKQLESIALIDAIEVVYNLAEGNALKEEHVTDDRMRAEYDRQQDALQRVYDLIYLA